MYLCKIAMPKAGIGYQTALASQPWGLPMNLKLLRPLPSPPPHLSLPLRKNDDPADQAPKPLPQSDRETQPASPLALYASLESRGSAPLPDPGSAD